MRTPFLLPESPLPPFTVAWLKNLEPGDSLVYYRGNLHNDIDASDPSQARGGSKGAPNYCKLLQAVRDTAERLEDGGKIMLSERKMVGEYRAPYIEYTATGVDPAKGIPRRLPKNGQGEAEDFKQLTDSLLPPV